MNEKHIRILATVATIAAVCMYTSYGLQIQSHLAGHKGNPIQSYLHHQPVNPAATTTKRPSGRTWRIDAADKRRSIGASAEDKKYGRSEKMRQLWRQEKNWKAALQRIDKKRKSSTPQV